MIPEWNSFINADCMEYMKQFPDKFFSLAIVDAPYGAGLAEEGGCKGWFAKYHQKPGNVDFVERERVSTASRYKTHYTCGIRKCRKSYANWRNMGGEIRKKILSWDVAPGKEYFEELFRISRNQIIWGGNYFELPPTRCFVVWDKKHSEDFSMAMAEYAWTSFNSNAKIFRHTPMGNPNDPRFHPTSRPIALYEWLLGRYAKENDTILDTHVGSGSSLIACHRTGHKYIGFEIDEEYYRQASERITRETQQMNIFDMIGGKE